jgi:hypothetical protein
MTYDLKLESVGAQVGIVDPLGTEQPQEIPEEKRQRDKACGGTRRTEYLRNREMKKPRIKWS